MSAYTLEIKTLANPAWSECRPKFETHKQADQYGKWLMRRHPERILGVRPVLRHHAQPDAVFNRELLWL